MKFSDEMLLANSKLNEIVNLSIGKVKVTEKLFDELEEMVNKNLNLVYGKDKEAEEVAQEIVQIFGIMKMYSEIEK